MDWKKLAASVVVCQLAGILGSVFTISSIPTWYAALAKPSFNPPNWVFGPVWTTLYLLMGISLYLVWTEGAKGKDVTTPMRVFGLQLVLNTAWSFLFFYLQSPILGLMEIVVLWGAIVWTIKEFYGVKKEAAYLLVPYILWVSFAAVLNFFLWRLN